MKDIKTIPPNNAGQIGVTDVLLQIHKAAAKAELSECISIIINEYINTDGLLGYDKDSYLAALDFILSKLKERL